MFPYFYYSVLLITDTFLHDTEKNKKISFQKLSFWFVSKVDAF